MSLNKKQRVVVLIGVLLIVVSCLCPPWVEKRDLFRGREHIYTDSPIGYHLIFRPPYTDGNARISVDFGRLALEWILVVVLAVGLAFIYQGRRKETDNHPVATKPTQIKSAIANSGTFDPADPSIIRESVSECGPIDLDPEDLRDLTDLAKEYVKRAGIQVAGKAVDVAAIVKQVYDFVAENVSEAFANRIRPHLDAIVADALEPHMQAVYDEAAQEPEKKER